MNQQAIVISGGFSQVQIQDGFAVKRVEDPQLLKRERQILLALIGTLGIPQIDPAHPKNQIRMTCVPGDTIGQIVGNQMLSGANTIRIMCGLAAVMTTLHNDHQILHNDICPYNTFYSDKEDQTNIIDFGAAAFSGNYDSPEIRSYGKPEYKSPEKIDLNMPFGLPSDIFSLGAVFYLLSEKMPAFSACYGDPAKQILRDTPLFPDSVSMETGRLIMAMLEKKPENRPQTEQVLAELKSLSL